VVVAGLSSGVGAQDHGDGCLKCHQGIENIREEGGQMLEAIRAMGKAFGDSHGCVVCHGGTPGAETKEEAHRRGSPAALAAVGPTKFYPDPGSMTVAHRTCGMCHPSHPYRLERACPL